MSSGTQIIENILLLPIIVTSWILVKILHIYICFTFTYGEHSFSQWFSLYFFNLIRDLYSDPCHSLSNQHKSFSFSLPQVAQLHSDRNGRHSHGKLWREKQVILALGNVRTGKYMCDFPRTLSFKAEACRGLAERCR